MRKKDIPKPKKAARSKITYPFLHSAQIPFKPVPKWRFALTAILVSILSFTLTAAGIVYLDISLRLDYLDTSLFENSIRAPKDPAAGNAVNILILGVDGREGTAEEAEIANDPDVAGLMNSDTTIVVHISSDRQNVSLMSIPRDSMVEIPACNTKNGEMLPQGIAMFNSAFPNAYNFGGQDLSSGASCTIRTIEHNTGIRIDEALIVNFSGLEQIVNKINGVNIYVEEEISAWGIGGLYLKPGCHHLNGYQAMQYARARHGYGLGNESDISRIERQQYLLSLLAKKIISKNILSNMPELYSLAGTVAENVATSYNLADIFGLASSLKDIKPYNIGLITVPWGSYPADPNRIQWTPDADILFNEIIKDQPISNPTIQYLDKKPAPLDPSSSPSSSSSPLPDATPSQIEADPSPSYSGESPSPKPVKLDPKAQCEILNY